jgi:alkylation response protein AidB-like acyl-CoA dehydrogenase
MEFELNEEQKLLKDSARKFMEKECPRAYARDKDLKEEFPAEFFDAMGKEGYMGLAIPEKYGGSGKGVVDMAILLEEIARVMRAASSAYFITAVFGGKSLTLYGNDEQRKKYLPEIAAGRLKVSLGLTEPNSGSDAASIRTTAKVDGNDYVINGSKIFISGAQEAGLIVIVARTADTPKKQDGITLFGVEGRPKGLSMRRISKLGIRAVDINELFFDDMRVPASCILGGLNKGWENLTKTLAVERIAVAAQAVGNHQMILEDALAYAKDRTQFGKPIGKFQMIQKMLCDMAVELEAARLLTYRAAAEADKGGNVLTEAAMAKLYASEACTRASSNGMQILGGYSYTMEYDMQRYYRDAKVNEIGAGTSEMQRIIIARALGL